jgi:hypothetical protein
LRTGQNADYWNDRSFLYSDDFRKFVDNVLLKDQLPEGWKVPGA